MTVGMRLATYVDLDNGTADLTQMSLSARLEAVLSDGRRLVLLDDRGWSSSGPTDIWGTMSVEDLKETARTVVGPDEPSDGRSPADMAADHWLHLAEILRRQGLDVDAQDLERLPHDVVLSERLRARVS